MDDTDDPLESDRVRLHHELDEWIDSIQSDIEEFGVVKNTVLEQAMFIGVFTGLNEDNAVVEQTLMMCTSGSRYIQDGILAAAVREQNIKMMGGRLGEDTTRDD